MKKNRLFLTSLVIGTVMLGGCSKDVEPDNQSSQNNTGYHNENSSSNQNNGTRDVLNDADYTGYVTKFSNEGFSLNLVRTEKTEDGGDLAIVGSGNGENSGTGNLDVQYASDDGNKEDILKDTQVAIHGTLNGKIFVANEVYLIRYVG